MLFLIATPIGNLADITLRALEVLQSCDYVLCEDTRHSLPLLKHHDIQKPLKSYHKFNESALCETILSDLRGGKQIALISDAGTPGIADPGQPLVARCHAENLPVTVIPGPCALIAALTLSGLPSDPFQFFGFLSKKERELKEVLFQAIRYEGTSICYESPHRILSTLNLIHQLAPQVNLCIVRELTKIYEEALHGTAQKFIEHFQNNPPKGEIVLLFQGNTSPLFPPSFTPKEIVNHLRDHYGLTTKEAIKIAASLSEHSRQEIYRQTHS